MANLICFGDTLGHVRGSGFGREGKRWLHLQKDGRRHLSLSPPLGKPMPAEGASTHPFSVCALLREVF